MGPPIGSNLTASTLFFFSESLALPEKERVGLVDALLLSLEPPADVDVEKSWKEEVDRRIQALDAGKVDTIPWEQVRDELWSGLGARRQS